MVKNVVVVGVCALEKKSRYEMTMTVSCISGQPMTEILARLKNVLECSIIIFTDAMLKQDPSSWPVVDVLLAIFSTGFPLEKAVKYIEMHPDILCINDVKQQDVLRNRTQTYKALEAAGIPTPRVLIPNSVDDVVEIDDGIVINGVVLKKPFVEKPNDADDHHVRIYYSGGGVRELFRKSGNSSSIYLNGEIHVRRNGAYIYEEFLHAVNSWDIKVYAVLGGPSHAEARKSPTVDGIVERDKHGRERRVVISLTPEEEDAASRVCRAFGHRVCGFDILRTCSGMFYVFDVGGWSFVKDDVHYWDACAARLAEHIRSSLMS